MSGEKKVDPRVSYLVSMLLPVDFYVQLAEEASELSQAALKMARLIEGRNPPRKTKEECILDLIEEVADVRNALSVLNDIACREHMIEECMDRKMDRWVKGIRELYPEVEAAPEAVAPKHDALELDHATLSALKAVIHGCLKNKRLIDSGAVMYERGTNGDWLRVSSYSDAVILLTDKLGERGVAHD